MENLDEKLSNISEFVSKRNESIAETDRKWTLEDELLSLDRLYGAALPLIRTGEIHPNDARNYHDYHKTKRIDGDVTCAVYLTLSEIFATIIDEFGDGKMSDHKYEKASIFAYIIRYTQDLDSMRKKDQTSIVIQVAKDNGSDDPTAYPKLYNLGDLCPPKCPEQSTIVINCQ